VELAAIAEEAGLAAPQVAEAPVPVDVGVTVTPFAVAPPATAVFCTSTVKVTESPALTGLGGWAWKATARPAGAWTVVAGEVVAAATSGRLVFAAVPLAVAVKVTVPAPEGVQVKVKGTVVLAAMAEEAGEAAPQVAEAPVPVAAGVTVTPFAVAPPAGAVFCTFTVSVTAWPALTVAGGWAWKVTANPAGSWTVVAGLVVAAAVSAAPELAAVPLAVAVKVTVPAPEGVQVKV
jgi:hypothetical protein